MKKKHVKYLIEALVTSTGASLMMKFIPYRTTKPLPTWVELLYFFPAMFIIMVIVLFIKDK